MPVENDTLDTLLEGRIKIAQSRKGYRFSVDAILLADFADLRGPKEIIDLGTGNGVIPLVVAALNTRVRVTGVEIQPEMVARALRSVELNRLADRVTILQGDVRALGDIFAAGRFDAAICNPPYRGPGSGRINPDHERRVARHEIAGSLDDFLRAGGHALRPRGKLAVVYPAARLPALLEGLRREGLEPKRLRLVHSFAGAEARLALVEGVKGAGSELKILPPLFIYTRGKSYTPEVEAILAGRFSASRPSANRR